jgi:predicted LPLAT superfamily acyltransferase
MMDFRPCIVIPIYNHKDTIAAVAGRLAPYGLPILIVDDGSDDATQEVLRALAAAQPLVRLFRLPRNAGKGAAVQRGIEEADAAGYSHALQVDADGQHALDDVPRFVEQARKLPLAVVAGTPLYDASAPASRRYGRLVTSFWVVVETLSTAIGDAMCGFRMYPVAPTLQLMRRVRIAPRMPFDIEIIVRLAWAGLPVVNLPTRVIYPPGGLSHFDMWRDNFRISATHTRLFFGMLPRLPLLLWRKLAPARAGRRHWSTEPERGSALGIRIVMGAYRLLGDRAARWLLRPIVAWFFLRARGARAASAQYLERLQAHCGATPAPTARNVYRHMLAFAESNLDKLAAWSGALRHEAIEFPARAEFEALLASGRGALLLGGHLGNLEALRALANLNAIARVNAVVYSDNARRFTEALAAVDPRYAVNLIHIARLGPDTAILLREKIERGELLVIVGDRTPPADNERVVGALFLGRPALFPQGPFILAALLECPVYLLFCLRERDGYHILFERFADAIRLPRGARAEAIAGFAQRYASCLESLCRRAPFQWFNFFDFWARGSRSTMEETR